MADRRLRASEGCFELAGAALARRRDEREEAEPDGVAEGGEGTGELLGVGLGERGGDDRRAARVDSLGNGGGGSGLRARGHDVLLLTIVDIFAIIDPSIV